MLLPTQVSLPHTAGQKGSLGANKDTQLQISSLICFQQPHRSQFPHETYVGHGELGT